MLNFLIFGSLGLYIYGAWKCWRNFDRTNFNRTLGTKVVMSLFWPALYVANGSYRQNFHRTLRGRD
jgi:hypothetical protein